MKKKDDKKVTAGELWNYLISSRSEYDPEGMLISKIDAHKDTPAAQIGFQLHFKAIERASLLGFFKR